jgi:hypothetical protein
MRNNRLGEKTGNEPPRIPSKASIFVSAAAAGIGIGVLSLLVEHLVERPQQAITLLTLSDEFVAALTAGICVLVLRYNSRKRRLLDLQRFELIRESTQQIRQALQLITDSAEPGTRQQHVIIYAVDHIEWVLQEVLPTLHQEPKEVQARLKDTSEPEVSTS